MAEQVRSLSSDDLARLPGPRADDTTVISGSKPATAAELDAYIDAYFGPGTAAAARAQARTETTQRQQRTASDERPPRVHPYAVTG